MISDKLTSKVESVLKVYIFYKNDKKTPKIES